ncbi:uncharacterized protein LOC117181262 [Belonocnema kinseyi]|uniref:uncharacterized protein LOC117181262 n=1 Tax=Belonocnema kinseyi TaxID=2817044 RepID=UPI00143CDD4A|nr:uncharacterized protein LOC117181262 [Belonocnema kinseyi]
MSSEINKLKRHKGQIISQVDRFIDSISGELSKGKIESKLRTLTHLWETFETVQDRIEELELKDVKSEQQPERIGIWEQERCEFEDKYHTAVGLANDRLAAIIRDNQAARADNNQQNLEPQIVPGVARPINYNFPLLNLPKFNGNYDKWLLFKDTFNATVHTNQDVPPVVKLQYLRGSLKGDALQIISTISTSDDNYTVAWELLLSRYDNKRLVINTHVKQLLDLPIVTKGSHSALRSLIDHIQTHTQALRNLDQPVDQWGTILIYLVINKLDFETRKDWEARVNSNNTEAMPTLDQLIKFLTNKCQTLELVDKERYNFHDSNKGCISKKDKKVALASTSQSPCVKDISIKLVEGLHAKYVGGVTTLLHLERQAFPDKTMPTNSQESQPVTTICAQQESFSQANDSPQISNKDKRTDITASAVNHSSQQQQASYVTVLSTTLIDIYDRDGNIYTCRALLDTGSQPNMITTKLLPRLKIPSDEVDVSVIPVAAMEAGVNKAAHVRIKSKLDNFTANLQCLVTPQITVKLPQVPLDGKQVNIPENIRLAGPCFERTSDIDLLIGAGVFLKVIDGGQINLGKNKPVLQKTKFGWIVGGEWTEEKHLKTPTTCNLLTLNRQLEKFWKLR